jgi:cysteinyl-tRNA synthetase
MPIRLFNTLTNQQEEVFAADGKRLRMYACGPTVYDYGHIGNFRTFVHVDILRRTLLLEGLKVEHVMNITDVDDKIIRNAAAEGKNIEAYTAKYTQAFLEDMNALRIERPEHLSRATEHIAEMVAMIQTLTKRGLAYQTEDGSWYFRIAGFPSYGKLSKKDFAGMEDGARVDVDEYDKDSARDFALWKAPKPDEYFWNSEIGPGRPGWHIECSAMAREYLGDSFDVHAGGEDLMFPHHENEIAQSESATGKPFVRHWMHVRFLLVEGRKMSKSEGNFFTLRDLLLKGYKSSAIRFLLTSVPYRHQFNFTLSGLTESAGAVERLRVFHARLATGKFGDGTQEELHEQSIAADKAFTAALEDDLNTAEARAAIFDLVRQANTAVDQNVLLAGNATEILALLAKFDSIFDVLTDRDAEVTRAALAWAELEGVMDQATAEVQQTFALSDADIEKLIADRNDARKRKDFKQSDAIRDELAVKGILLEDSKDGVRWKRK